MFQLLTQKIPIEHPSRITVLQLALTHSHTSLLRNRHLLQILRTRVETLHFIRLTFCLFNSHVTFFADGKLVSLQVPAL